MYMCIHRYTYITAFRPEVVAGATAWTAGLRLCLTRTGNKSHRQPVQRRHPQVVALHGMGWLGLVSVMQPAKKNSKNKKTPTNHPAITTETANPPH